MKKIRIVTDSTADIPKELVEKFNLTVVPLKVHFGESTYLDGVNLSASEFYKKLEQSPLLPTTSQPSPLDFVDTFKGIHDQEEGNVSIISIHLSSALSGTYQSANLAKNMIGNEVDVTVIDSKMASYAIGIIVIAVAEAAESGKTKEQCILLAEQLIEETVVYFVVDTLEYLQKGGRIGKASALFGSLLNIKPILSLDRDGEVYAIDKVRGQKKAFGRLIQYLKEYAGDHKVRVGISHGEAYEEVEQIKEMLHQDFEISDMVITDIGPVIGTHVGPKTVAVTMYKIL
ncbi:DegV family protein [Microaerobacter geothermalis]|uniref:DegV family protein n=1 Tax=Microaerobacter geothermalis TaxID=674972 RepID=UPI001F36CEBE|nr:DegV family protein [Microaerobacter geothermalis]MCF6095058.1 DegV family protein [Microaerobacter geothermalis]